MKARVRSMYLGRARLVFYPKSWRETSMPQW